MNRGNIKIKPNAGENPSAILLSSPMVSASQDKNQNSVQVGEGNFL